MKTFQEKFERLREYFYGEEYQSKIKASLKLFKENPFILYGAGVEGIEYANILRSENCLPVCFCDKNKSGIDNDTNIPIISPDKLNDIHYKDANIVISSSLYREDIEQDLLALGINMNRVIPRNHLLVLLCYICSKNKKDEYGEYIRKTHFLHFQTNWDKYS